MKKLSARATAAKILTEVIQNGSSLTEALQTVSVTNKSDKGFIQELCYGVLRWYYFLDFILDQLLQSPIKPKEFEVKALLLLGLYQIYYLKTPSHAALNETVEAARELNKSWATKLINAVLRNFLRNEAEITEKVSKKLSAKFSHPQWLLDLIKKSWPKNWEDMLSANNERPPMILRVNQQQNSTQEYLDLLIKNNIEAELISNTKSALVLKTPMDIGLLPGFLAGKVSVQDGAAQLAAELLDLKAGQIVLDACAAPGGKSAHILEIENNLKKLIAVDIDAERCKKIQENIQRLKSGNAVTVLTANAADPKSWWNKESFDRILLDAPCSATGVIRRHPDIKLLRRASDINNLAQTQFELLEALWPLLKSKGLLVYATCSVLPQENSEVLKKFLNSHSDAQEKKILAPWGHEQTIGRQILPGENSMDGFYYAVLQKS